MYKKWWGRISREVTPALKQYLYTVFRFFTLYLDNHTNAKYIM